jgi:hypothetical protein
MELISKAVGWENKETLLDEYYPSGRSCKGGNAYPLLMLLKCMVIQNWFHMPRDFLGLYPIQAIKNHLSNLNEKGVVCPKRENGIDRDINGGIEKSKKKSKKKRD